MSSAPRGWLLSYDDVPIWTEHYFICVQSDTLQQSNDGTVKLICSSVSASRDHCSWFFFLTEVINRAISFLQELVSFHVTIQSGPLNANVDLASSSSPEEEPDLWNHRVSFECEDTSPDHAGSNCHWRLSLSSFSFHLPPSPLVSHGPVANPRRYCRHIFIISERLRAHCALMSLWTVAPLIRGKMLLRMQWSVHITAPAAGGWADVILHL